MTGACAPASQHEPGLDAMHLYAFDLQQLLHGYFAA